MSQGAGSQGWCRPGEAAEVCLGWASHQWGVPSNLWEETSQSPLWAVGVGVVLLLKSRNHSRPSRAAAMPAVHTQLQLPGAALPSKRCVPAWELQGLIWKLIFPAEPASSHLLSSLSRWSQRRLDVTFVFRKAALVFLCYPYFFFLFFLLNKTFISSCHSLTTYTL